MLADIERRADQLDVFVGQGIVPYLDHGEGGLSQADLLCEFDLIQIQRFSYKPESVVYGIVFHHEERVASKFVKIKEENHCLNKLA